MSGARDAAYRKGLRAEALAAEALAAKGLEVLEMRYKTAFGEVDIVAKGQDCIVFVEVKARKTVDESLYAVSAKSRVRIQNAALHFMAAHPEYADLGMRFDVIAVTAEQTVEKTGEQAGESFVSHLDNAWFADT